MKGYMLRRLAVLTLSSIVIVPSAQADIDQATLDETEKQLENIKEIAKEHEFTTKQVDKVSITIKKHDAEILSTGTRTYLGNKYRGGSVYSSHVNNANQKPTEIVEIKYNIYDKNGIRVVHKDPTTEKEILKEEIIFKEEINLNKDINLVRAGA